MHDGTARVRLNGEPINQMARIGTFSEYVVCPAEQVVAVRKDLPWTHAAIIGCSVATGVGAVIRHANVQAGSSVLVIGCGGVGLNIVQGAKFAGAKRIIACDLLDNKLVYAREFGATHTINAKTEDVLKQVQQLTGGFGADYAFDAIGGEQTAAFGGSHCPCWPCRVGWHPGLFGPGGDLAIGHGLWRKEAHRHLLRFDSSGPRLRRPGRPGHGQAHRSGEADQPHLCVR
jgi:threonine dehydrogenase-like Zn-dependent dehydrogenase